MYRASKMKFTDKAEASFSQSLQISVLTGQGKKSDLICHLEIRNPKVLDHFVPQHSFINPCTSRDKKKC